MAAQHSSTHPLTGGFAVTPSDIADLPYVTRQIRLPDNGTPGNVVIVWASGLETTERIAAGEVFDWQAVRIKSTGTTASGLRGYF